VTPSVAGTVLEALDYLTGLPMGLHGADHVQLYAGFDRHPGHRQAAPQSPIDRRTLNDMVSAGIARLYSFQHDDGGWGWWQDDPSRVFMTSYVVSGLGQAKASWEVDNNTIEKGRNC